jgi:hypothetical protein
MLEGWPGSMTPALMTLAGGSGYGGIDTTWPFLVQVLVCPGTGAGS